MQEERGIFPSPPQGEQSTTSAQRFTFAVVSAIAAFILLLSLVIDIVVGLVKNTFTDEMILVSAIFAAYALFWVVLPLVLQHRYPLWAGAIAYASGQLSLAYFIAYGGELFTITTALQILPVLALYLGWFWRPSFSIPVYGCSLVIMIAALLIGASTREGASLPAATGTLALLITSFAYIVGSYLRWRNERMASTDGLTGALNRRGVLSKLRVEMRRAADTGEPLSIAIIDFDQFKQLNDTKGHAFGDRVLRDTIAYWRTMLRGYDIIGRTGGDEFIIIFPKTNAAEADAVLSRIRAKSPHAWTWGLTQLRPGDQLEQIFLRGDRRLYEWKDRRREATGPIGVEEKHAEVNLRPPERGWKHSIRDFMSRQNNYSVVSAAVGCVFLVTLTVTHVRQESTASSAIGYLVVFAVLIGSAGAILAPLLKGRDYPKVMTYIVPAIVFALGTIVMLRVDDFTSALNVLLYSGLMALYLGAFSGTMFARVLMLTGLMVTSGVAILRFYPHDSADERMILLTAVPYSFIVCWFLFEIGSYLYWRSNKRVFHDSLTGALNRFGIKEFGTVEIQRAARAGSPLCLAVIDFVGFKAVNDTFGHSAGDKLLKESVALFRTHLKPYDLVVRTGGDEFALILPYRNIDAAKQVIQELKQHSRHPWVAGIAQMEDDDDLDSLLARADEDLYAQRGITLQPTPDA